MRLFEQVKAIRHALEMKLIFPMYVYKYVKRDDGETTRIACFAFCLIKLVAGVNKASLLLDGLIKHV